MPRPSAVRLPRASLAVLGAGLALAVAASGFAPAPPAAAVTRGGDGKPITNAKGVVFGIQSHRGGAEERPENSHEAYQYSVNEGFDDLETDLLFTKDGVGVMNHYDTLPARCTHAGQKIHQMTLAEVQEVRCEDFRTKEKTVPIPTFEEFAAIVKGSDIKVSLDIKTYSGQPASGERLYADRAMKLLKEHGLLKRSSIISFRWATTLPTIRKHSKSIYVLGLDNKPMDLGRVRLADKLGASAFGIAAINTPVNLMKYTRSLGMDAVPWDVKGKAHLAYAIYFSPKVKNFSTDAPSRTRADLIAGKINLNPAATAVVTKLAKPVTVAKKATYKAKKRKYPRVLGVAVPSNRLSMLDTVTVKVTVTKGPGKGYFNVGASNSPIASGIKKKLPKGTKSFLIKVPLGDKGKLRVFTTKKAKLTVQVVEYTNLSFG